MTELNEDIDSYFKESIEPSEMSPSNKVWETIDQKLDKKQFVNLQKRISRLLYLTIGLSAIVAVLITLHLSQHFQKNKISISKNENKNVDLRNFSETNSVSSKESREDTKASVLASKNSTNKNNSSLSFNKTEAYSAKAIKNYTKEKENIFNSVSNSSSFKSSEGQVAKKINKDVSQTEIKSNYPSFGNNKKQMPLIKKDSLLTSESIPINKHSQNANYSISNHTKPNFISDSTLNNNSKKQDAKLVKTNPFTNSLQDSSEVISFVNNTIKIDSSINSDAAISNSYFNPSKIPEQSSKYKFSVLGFFSPEFFSSKLSDNNTNDNQNTENYSDSESPDFSYTTGLKIGYLISQKFNIYTGLTYSSFSYSIKPRTLYAKQTTNGETQYILATSSGETPLSASPTLQVGDSVKLGSSSIQRLQYIATPLLCQYQISRKRFNYYVFAGISSNFFIAGKTEVSYENLGTESTTKIEGLRKIYFAGIIGAGLNYTISQKFSILVEPTFKKAITSINRNTPISSYPYSFGLGIGLVYHF